MRKGNISEISEEKNSPPAGKYCTIDQPLNEAIGGDSQSMDLTKRWPFDVELSKIPPGKTNYPYHMHSTQWEFYIIVSGQATVRHKDGTTEVGAGDFFAFGPGEAHHMVNNSDADVTYFCVADNPINDHAYYPDSDKWLLKIPLKRQVIKGEKVDPYAGEESTPA